MLKRLLVCVLLLFLIAGVAVGQTGKDIRAKDLYVGGRWAKFRSYVEIIVFGNAYDALRLNYTGTGHNIFDFQADGVSVLKLEKSGTLTLVGTLSMAALSLTGDTNPLLDLNPSGIDTQDVINITPSAGLSTEDALWRGLVVNGAALDPTAGSIRIMGLCFDFSGVALGSLPTIYGACFEMPSMAYPAIHISDGNIEIHNVVPATAAATFTGIDVNVEAGSQAATSDYHALDVATPSTPGGHVVAVGTHTDVDVIHQHIGAFGDMDWGGIYTGAAFVDKTTEFLDADTGGANDIEIFSDQNDYILLADAAPFDEIRVVLYTEASKDIKLTFFYGDGSQAWTAFGPGDDTEGMSESGTIRFEADDLVGWGTDTVNEITAGALGGAVEYYWIKIVRTRHAVSTDPVESIFQILSATAYGWDKNADLTINDIIANDTVTTLTTTYTPSAAQVIDAVGDVILANATTIVLDPDADYVLTSTPTIADGANGRVIYVTCGDGEANTVTIQDQGTLGGSNIILLSGATSRDITGRSTVSLRFNGTNWIEFGGGGASVTDKFIPANMFKPQGDGGDNNIIPTIQADTTNNRMFNRSTSKEDTQDMDWYTEYELPEFCTGIITLKIYTRASDFANCTMTMTLEDQDGNVDATGVVVITPSGNDTWEEFTYTPTSAYGSLEHVWKKIAIISLDSGDTADFGGVAADL